MVSMEIAQKKFSSKNILIADNALIKMTCPTANLFKPSISMDNYLQVDKQKLFIGRFFYPPNYSGTFQLRLTSFFGVEPWRDCLWNRLRSNLSAPVWATWQLIFGFWTL